jgi:CheY-like chemotaxis protein
MNPRDFCILCVDDNEDDLCLIRYAAQRAQLADCLHTVNSGSQAVDYLQGHSQFSDRQKFPLPKVVLLDLRMPRMNGLEVLHWLRSQPDLVGIVVIIFSASAHPDDIKQAWEQGANAFVQKPSTQAELVRLLRLLKEFWGEFHQSPALESTESSTAKLIP